MRCDASSARNVEASRRLARPLASRANCTSVSRIALVRVTELPGQCRSLDSALGVDMDDVDRLTHMQERQRIHLVNAWFD